MKLNKIILFFLFALPISVGLRFLQLYFTVDAKTGFYLNEVGNYGPILLVLILLCALFVGIFARFTFNKPENPPKGNIWLSISSFLLGFSILAETFFQGTEALIFWQSALLKILGIASAIFFILFGVNGIIRFKFPNILTAIPVMYLIIRMISDFTSIAKLALISDNVILIAVYCVTLLFFLNFTKLYNGADKETGFKNLLSFGLASVVLCFTHSIPNIIINILSDGGYRHISMNTTVSILLIGIFILTFTISYFSNKE